MADPTHRRNDLQGLRGVAVLLVVGYHAGLPLPGGFAGVDVFFVLSGYVIAGMLGRERARTGRVSYPRFYGGRAIRLLPAAALATTVTLVLSAALESPLGAQQTTAATGAGAATLTTNVVLLLAGDGYFDPASRLDPLVHLWSLGVEEQFYLLLPVALSLLPGRRRRRTLGVVVVLSLVLYLGLRGGQLHLAGLDGGQAAFYLLPTRAWELGAGGLLATWSGRRPRRMPVVVPLAGAVAVAAAALGAPQPTLLAAAGALTLLPAGPVSRMLARPWLVWVGDRSFSWYLWHWPVLVFAGLLWPGSSAALLLAAGGSLGVATAARSHLEEPVRRSFPRAGTPVACLVVLCVAVPALASTGLAMGSRAGWGRPGLADIVRTSSATTLGRSVGCLVAGRPAVPGPPACTRGTGPKGSIWLAGDSHADSLSDATALAAAQLGYRTVLRTAQACPLTSVGRWTTTRLPACSAYVEQVLREAEVERPAVVVLSHSSVAYERVLRDAGVPAPDLAWAASLAATTRRLTAAGVRVLVVQDVPRLGERASPCRFGALLPLRCGRRRADLLAVQGPVATTERRALRGVRGVRVADPFPVLCGARSCDPVRGRVMLYADNQHLNSFGSLSLEPWLFEELAATLG